MIKLVDIDSVKPSTYNPRISDSKRLDIIELSLRKLGFLLPIFATPEGEILSGHQRQMVAKRMGFEKIPVYFTKSFDLEKRKAINIAFNRGTNDMDRFVDSKTITLEILSHDLMEISKQIPDKIGDERFPCYFQEQIDPKLLVKANSKKWESYSRNIARLLYKVGIKMNVVCKSNGECINGAGRIQCAIEKKQDTIGVVYITDGEAEFSRLMLNYLSMDFDIHERYADTLRYNSFRRVYHTRDHLGYGFIFDLGMHGKIEGMDYKSAKNFDENNPLHIRKWIEHYGSSVVDFGAGHYVETNILRGMGVKVNPFEPFRIREGADIDPSLGRESGRKFLESLATGEKYTTVFISAVLNSVPFKEDRRHVVRIIASLMSKNTLFCASAVSNDSTPWRNAVKETKLVNDTRDNELRFALDYETNITLSDFSDKPKVQKFHSKKEFYDLMDEFFENVRVSDKSNSRVDAVCRNAKPIVWEDLQESLKFEFDLPYPDGTRMGLSDFAIECFKKRLGLNG